MLHRCMKYIDKLNNIIIYTPIFMLILLSHWGPVTHKCVDNLTIISFDTGLSSLSESMIEYC